MKTPAPKNLFAIGRLPEYDVSAINGTTEGRGRVGAAWINEEGHITLKLNPFVQLHQDGHLILTLFPKPSAKLEIRKVAKGSRRKKNYGHTNP